MNEKRIVATGQIYRGVAIIKEIEGCKVFGEDGKEFPFESESEARSFIDAWLVANERVMVLGEVPVQ